MSMPVLSKIDINWQRGVYIVLFFCNAIFATMFKTVGKGMQARIGLLSEEC